MNDPTAASRKKDHIELAFESQVKLLELDDRFYYEPILSAFPEEPAKFSFLGKALRAPIWVSSMTGGTEKARMINQNLARACREFGMGMGLGSCRSLLESDEYLEDFNIRPLIGPDLPLYANLGIAQVEQLIRSGETEKVDEMLLKLDADGLFIHVNPMQEWLQPEGDIITLPPIETIRKFIALHTKTKVIVKEVGQGMGRESLKALMQLPIEGIEFAAHGGTNFAKLELLRNGEQNHINFAPLTRVGHSAEDMVNMVNGIIAELPDEDLNCRTFIISGGITNFIDGYYLTEKINGAAVYGQASALLRHAAVSYDDLQQYLNFQLKGFAVSRAYLRLRK